ncbi:hypothetical protein LXL04_039418 [Taraxacum kok-saghyz]
MTTGRINQVAFLLDTAHHEAASRHMENGHNFCIVLMRSMYIGSRTSPTVCFTSQLNPIKGEDFGTMSVSGIFIRFSVSSKMMFADDPPSIGILLTNKLAMCKFIRSQVGISVISNRIDVKI